MINLLKMVKKVKLIECSNEPLFRERIEIPSLMTSESMDN